jgi:hypothetical protein
MSRGEINEDIMSQVKSKLIILTGKPEPDVKTETLQLMKEQLELLIKEHNNIVKDIREIKKDIQDLAHGVNPARHKLSKSGK